MAPETGTIEEEVVDPAVVVEPTPVPIPPPAEPVVNSAYAVPGPGPAPAQSSPETRDIAKRERTMHDYRAMEQRLYGNATRPEVGTNAPVRYNLAQETENLDLEMFQQGYDARSRILHEPETVLDEHERLQEINALYLDQCMEKYAERVTETETARDEQKYGRGYLGCARRWFSNTDAGKAVHVAGKVALAGVATVGTAGTFLAPAGVLMARKLGVDAAIEAVQYTFFERPVLRNLREAGLRRHDYMARLQALRNEVANRDDDHDLAANGQQLNIVGDLHDNLEEIITEFDNLEREMIAEEEHLAHIRMIGKSIRTAASVALSAAAIYELFENGLSMGIANLDKMADPTQALVHTAAHPGMAASAAAHHVVTAGTNPGVYHDLRLASDGMRFMYEQGETMSNGLISHGLHTLAESHLVGAAYSTAQTIGEYAALGAAALGDIPGKIYGIIRDRRHMLTMRNVRLHPLEEENKEHEAVFTLTGRDALGDASGVNHEISDLAGTTRGNEEFRKGLEIKKEKFTVGSIMRVPYGLLGHNHQALPPFVIPNEDVYIQVNGWTDRGDGKKVDLQYIIIDPNPPRPLTVNSNGIVNYSSSELCTEAKADNIIDQADRVAESYDEFVTSRSASSNVGRLREERGHPEIETSQTWQASHDFVLQTEDAGAQNIVSGEIIQIQSLNSDKTRANVRIRDANGVFRGPFSGARIEEVIANANYIERQEQGRQLKNQINEIIRNQGSSVDLQPNLVFRYLNHNDPAAQPRWIGIVAVNEDGNSNHIAIVTGDLINGDVPTGKPLKAAVNAASAEHYNFQEFINRFGNRDPQGNYVEELRYTNTRLS